MRRINHCFIVVEDTAYYRPVGQVSFPEVSKLISTALSVCRKNRIRKLLYNTKGLTGFGVPNTVQRYWFCVQLATNAKEIIVAVVAQEQMIDPDRFGTTVARNRGAIADIFSSESDAQNWLFSVGRDVSQDRNTCDLKAGR